jgi:hypothetical protein
VSAPSGRRRCSLARVLACVVVWGAGAAGALLVASETSVGPVVLDLSTNHGVHAGDVLAVGMGAVVATATTGVILLPCIRLARR